MWCCRRINQKPCIIIIITRSPAGSKCCSQIKRPTTWQLCSAWSEVFELKCVPVPRSTTRDLWLADLAASALIWRLKVFWAKCVLYLPDQTTRDLWLADLAASAWSDASRFLSCDLGPSPQQGSLPPCSSLIFSTVFPSSLVFINIRASSLLH